MMNERLPTPSIDDALELFRNSLQPYSLQIRSLDAGEEFQIIVSSASNTKKIELILSRDQLLNHSARRAFEMRLRSELGGDAS